jgi:hypothetical protein
MESATRTVQCACLGIGRRLDPALLRKYTALFLSGITLMLWRPRQEVCPAIMPKDSLSHITLVLVHKITEFIYISCWPYFSSVSCFSSAGSWTTTCWATFRRPWPNSLCCRTCKWTLLCCENGGPGLWRRVTWSLPTSSGYLATDGQSAIPSWCNLWPDFSLLFDSCGFLDVEHPLWREDGSVTYLYFCF